jgi:hypothetical protein
MKTFFSDAQRAERNEILNKMWRFLQDLEEGQLKRYSKHYPNEVAQLAEEMGVENYIKVLNDSINRGYYNPKHSYFITNELRNTFYSYEDWYELFAILAKFN